MSGAVKGHRPPGPRYQTREDVDFCVIGSGAAGGIIAAELSEAGFSVVLFEQGPYIRPHQFSHDEMGVWLNGELSGSTEEFPQTFRASEDVEAQPAPLIPPLMYARLVGGSSVHFTANFWRFRPVDFHERSLVGSISGTGFADWPVTYEEMEPYYTRVDWEVGISGAPGPFDPPRSRPYPVPPLPVKSSGVLLERGARALGYHPFPAPMAILSQPHNDRAACIQCGACMAYGCEVGAKSSSLSAMIPRAEASGRCEIRPESTVFRIELDERGRARDVLYWDADGVEHAQRARVVVVSANGAETTRLLLMSESSRFPDGLANSSGKLGKYLMFNGQATAMGTFAEPLNEYKGPQVTRVLWDWYDSDPQRGFYGGGGIDGRMSFGPALLSFLGKPPDVTGLGPGLKAWMTHAYTRSMEAACHSTSLPQESNNVTLDPATKDKWGRPALRVTYRDHDDDLAMMGYLQQRAIEILEAAGAEHVWQFPVVPQTVGAHLLGTARMGDDPASSVVDRYHRTHEVENLFICDGSSFVTSGRGQPTMTIMALAFRAADHLKEAARRGEI